MSELSTWASTCFLPELNIDYYKCCVFIKSLYALSTLLAGLTLKSKIQAARILGNLITFVSWLLLKLGAPYMPRTSYISTPWPWEPWFKRVFFLRGPWSFIKNIMMCKNDAEFNTITVHYVQWSAAKSKYDKSSNRIGVIIFVFLVVF